MLQAKREALFSAATEYAKAINDGTARALCVAATEYAQARLDAATGVTAAKAQAKADAPTWPFGKKKGVPLSEVTKRDLEWLVGVTEESLADPAKERFRDDNLRRLEQVREELARR